MTSYGVGTVWCSGAHWPRILCLQPQNQLRIAMGQTYEQGTVRVHRGMYKTCKYAPQSTLVKQHQTLCSESAECISLHSLSSHHSRWLGRPTSWNSCGARRKCHSWCTWSPSLPGTVRDQCRTSHHSSLESLCISCLRVTTGGRCRSTARCMSLEPMDSAAEAASVLMVVRAYRGPQASGLAPARSPVWH